MEQAIENNKNQKGQKGTLDKIADGISTGMLILCVLVFIVMVFAVSYGVIGRYLPFVRNPRWTQELGILCMVWLCFLSAGFAIKEGLHVRMTIINYLVPKKIASLFHRCAYLLLLIINAVWVIYGIQLMQLTRMAKMSATRWPMSIIYMSVVIGGIYGAAMSVYRLLKGGF